MRLSAIIFTCLCTSGVAFGVQAAPAQDPAHAHAAPAAAHAATTASHARWAADAPLRDGMQRVRTALAELRHHEMGHMSPDQAREQVAEIDAAVASIFANCKLAPDADAALHTMLVPLLDGARRLREDPADKAAIQSMRDAVAPYPQQFDDAQAAGDARAH